MALKSQNTVLLMTTDVGSPDVLTAIEKVTDISGPSGTSNLIDATHLTSTGKEFLPGLADYGKIALTINFEGLPQQMRLRTKYATQALPHNYKLEVPDGIGGFHMFAFQAIVLSWALAAKVDDKIILTVELQTSGSVTYTAPV